MRTPILLGASPKTATTSAWVPVRYKNWRLVVEGLIDTELTLYHQVPETGEEHFITCIEGGTFTGPLLVRMEIQKIGTENTISVFAEEIT